MSSSNSKTRHSNTLRTVVNLPCPAAANPAKSNSPTNPPAASAIAATSISSHTCVTYLRSHNARVREAWIVYEYPFPTQSEIGSNESDTTSHPTTSTSSGNRPFTAATNRSIPRDTGHPPFLSPSPLGGGPGTG